MDDLELLELASAAFGARIAEVDQDQQFLPTPCGEWNVAGLITHVLGGNHMAVRLLEGAHRAEAIGERLLQQQASEQFPRDPMFSDLDLNPDLLDQGRDADQKQNSSGSERGSTVPGGAQNREQQPGLFVIEAPGKAGDPRQKGMNYYQLMTSTNLPEVVRAADFLSRNNVPVAVCRENGNNSDPDFVLQVLKPFPGNPERSAEGRQFKETLMRLGREYKRDHGGVDFNSLVPYKFQ